MGDFTQHVLLFLCVAFAIVLLGTFHAESSDARALRSLPWRALTFLVGCAVLGALVLVS